MRRRGQSASVAIVFMALMFISGFTAFYNQIGAFRQELKIKEDALSRQVDRARENLKVIRDGGELLVYNDWTKFSEIRYLLLFDEKNFVKKVMEVNVSLSPGASESFKLEEGASRAGVLTSLGNIFLEDTTASSGNRVTFEVRESVDGSLTPLRLYINPDNPKTYFVVKGLHQVYIFNTSTQELLGVRYVDAPKSLEDNPYRSWVYWMHPVIPFYDLSGWASWQMVSFTAEKSRTVYDKPYIFIYKFLCESGGQKVEYISGTSSYSYYIQQVSPQTFGGTAWILMLSATSGSGTNVFYSLVGPQSSNPGAANGLTLTVNPSGTSYANWAIASFSYPYFIIEKWDLVSSTYVADYYVYKITSGNSATNLPWVSGSSSSPYRRWSSSSNYPRQTVFVTRDGFFVWRDGSTWRSYNMEAGGYSEQYSYTPSYDVLAWKYTRYGIVLLRWNGFDILDSKLNLIKSVNLPEGYSWYYPLQGYFSNFLRERTDYGYEYFEHQLSLVDGSTALAVLVGSDGVVKVVKLTIL